MSYLSSSQLFSPLDFDEIESIMVGAVAASSRALREHPERQDMVIESLLSNIDDELEVMFASLVRQKDMLGMDDEDNAQ
jgi:hypothetical protein